MVKGAPGRCRGARVAIGVVLKCINSCRSGDFPIFEPEGLWDLEFVVLDSLLTALPGSGLRLSRRNYDFGAVVKESDDEKRGENLEVAEKAIWFSIRKKHKLVTGIFRNLIISGGGAKILSPRRPYLSRFCRDSTRGHFLKWTRDHFLKKKKSAASNFSWRSGRCGSGRRASNRDCVFQGFRHVFVKMFCAEIFGAASGGAESWK